MRTITPFLWYDAEARKAAELYVSTFPKSKITRVDTIEGTPSGTVELVSMTIWGHDFTLMSAGPFMPFTPAISFMVGCETKSEVDSIWKKLEKGGTILMPLQEYPFSERYGWIQDRFGVSWQLILTKPEGEHRPRIVPSLLFVGKKYGRAEEALTFYLSVFKDSRKGNLIHYGAGQEPNKKGTVMFSDFMLENTWFSAMDGGGTHAFTFNEAMSFVITCKTQDEIDYYWKSLSKGGKTSQCGWLSDKFGVSWQVVPEILSELTQGKDKKRAQRVTQKMLTMTKLDIKPLLDA